MRRRLSKLRPQALLNQTLFARNGDGTRTPPQSQSPSPASPTLDSPTLSLPFTGNSSRKEDSFYVDLEEPHRQYKPGDVIKGSVVFVIHRDVKLDSIQCGMHGSINIKNPLVKTKISRHRLFDDTITLWGKEPKQKGKAKAKDSAASVASANGTSSPRVGEETNGSARSNSTGSLDDENGSVSENGQVNDTLPRGRHVFKFEFEMPTKNVFSGIEFERGDISYHISASYFKHGAVIASKVTQQSVTVIVPNNVGTLSRPKPTCLSVEVRRKKRPAGVISAILQLRHRGYLRGESIPIKITVKHIRALRSVSGAIVTLSRISRVTASGSEPQTFRKDISQTVTPLFTDPNSYTATISTSIKIPPDTFPTTKALDVVSFQYYIEVVLDLGGHFEKQRRETDQYDPAKHGMLDTDKISSRRGFVNLWADVIVGTYRSEDDSQWQRVSSPYPDSIGTTSLRNGSVHGAISLNSDSVASSSNALDLEVPSYQEQMALHRPSDEKQRQRAYEQALLPSAPEGEFTFVPASAPALHAHLDGPNSHTNGHADKAELEREHLEALASQPDEDEEYVPQYQPSASIPSNAGPSAPSLPPIHDEYDTYEQDEDEDDLYTVSRHAIPPPTHPSAPVLPENSQPSAPTLPKNDEPSAPTSPKNDEPSAPTMHQTPDDEPSAPPLPSDPHLTNS